MGHKIVTLVFIDDADVLSMVPDWRYGTPWYPGYRNVCISAPDDPPDFRDVVSIHEYSGWLVVRMTNTPNDRPRFPADR